MEPNLRTFPTGAPYSRDKAEYRFRYIELILKWKDEFEAELQKRNGKNLALSKIGRAYRQGQLDIIKEILGK